MQTFRDTERHSFHLSLYSSVTSTTQAKLFLFPGFYSQGLATEPSFAALGGWQGLLVTPCHFIFSKVLVCAQKQSSHLSALEKQNQSFQTTEAEEDSSRLEAAA